MMFHSLILLFISCQIGITFCSPSVIIVGAGPAGIAAATKLLENGVTNITILEAENRIGGRIHSVKFGDAFVDIGAEYCHGQKGNVVYELAEKFNVLKNGSRTYFENVYYSNGLEIDSTLVEELEAILNDAVYGDDGNFNETGKSVGEVFTHKYKTKFLKKYENEPEKLKKLEGGLRFIEGNVLGLEGAFSWFESSAVSGYHSCEGDQGMSWNGHGYKTILEILMKSYPDPSKKLPLDDKIHLNKKVGKIDWNSGNSVTVQTLDNSSFTAQFVIFTPSVGVLKNQHKSMFSPHLPSIKQGAINAIGFDAVIKTFFYFPTKWWQDEDTSFDFFWNDEDIKSIDFPDGPKKDGISWIVQLRSIGLAPNNPNVFIGWITGDLVPEIEKMPLDILQRGSLYVFNKFLGKDYNVTEIGQMMRSTWYSNENFKGTYSFTKTGTYREDISYHANLGEPLFGAAKASGLLFAGEATNRFHFSTVHGAIETGHREAKRIIDINKILTRH